MEMMYTKLFSLRILGLTAIQSHSAVTWTGAVDILATSTDSQVVNTGDTHAAVNAAVDTTPPGTADLTLNGVVFETGDINAATNITATGSFTSSNAANLNPNGLGGGTPDYSTFLGDIDFGGGGDITINNLVAGEDYLIQVDLIPLQSFFRPNNEHRYHQYHKHD